MHFIEQTTARGGVILPLSVDLIQSKVNFAIYLYNIQE